MSTESPIGEGPQWDLPLDPPPPPPPPPPTAEPPRTPAAPVKPPPVARKAPRIPRVRIRPDPEPTDELLTPESVRGWGVSLALHTLLFLILAFWVYTIRNVGPATLETSLEPGGSLFGTDAGDGFEGALGLDAPLAVPEGPLAAVENPTLTVLPALTPELDPSVAPNPRAAAAGGAQPNPGGGVELGGRGGGSGDGFGVARFGTGTERVQGVEVKIGDPQFTLIWEGEADLDLHVQEPGGSHIFWPPENQKGAQGGELDVDNRYGPGPENIFWEGRGPDGVYKWFVHYYGPPPPERLPKGPARWRVRIKHAGKTQEFRGVLNNVDDHSRTYTFRVGGKDD